MLKALHVQSCQTLSNAVKFCQMLSNAVQFCQMLSNLVNVLNHDGLHICHFSVSLRDLVLGWVVEFFLDEEMHNVKFSQTPRMHEYV